MRVENCRIRLLRIRHTSGQALIEDGGKRVDVASGARRLATNLLGRDVVQRPNELARSRQPCRSQRLGEAEVGQVRVLPASDEDVLWLDVSVDESGLVRSLER